MLADDDPWTILLFVIIASVFVLSWICFCPRISDSVDDNASASAAQRQRRPRPPRPAARLPLAAAQRSPPPLDPRSALDGRQRLPQPITTAYLPAFAYNTSSMNSKVTAGTGEEEEAAAMCSVCLGVFEFGEMVRLLPVCLHLFHVECMDMWLAAHSTCPICRSGTDPTQTMTDVEQLPPV